MGEREKAFETRREIENQGLGLVSAAPLSKLKIFAINKVSVVLNDYEYVASFEEGTLIGGKILPMTATPCTGNITSINALTASI